MEKLNTAGFLLDGLSVYRELKQDPILKRFSQLVALLTSGENNPSLHELTLQYAEFCSALYESKFQGNFPDYLYRQVLLCESFFTAEAAKGNYPLLPEPIQKAAVRDLNGLYALSQITSADFRSALTSRYPNQAEQLTLLPDYISQPSEAPQTVSWGDRIDEIIQSYRQNGTGVFSEEIAFLFDGEKLSPVKNVDPIRLSDLKHYEAQRNKIVENTLSFLQNKPCNNILLYGDRGTGKSSTVKALLNEFHGNGLRIVQIEKKHLNRLSNLIDLLSDHPLRFIIFIDDLTFEENDEGFGALKACLEGSLSKKADNTVIYATSNRRHLVKETFSAREGDEVHRADTIDDSLSLSDRFGLTITFTLPDKAKYLDIVLKIAADRGLELNPDQLIKGAERFALQKAGRSPRVARQYIDQIQGRLETGLPIPELLEK